MKTGLIVCAGIFSFMNSFQNRAQLGGYKNISVNAFNELMADSDVIIIDVRTPGEIKSGKIENALEIDFMNRDFESQISVLNKDATYLIYCRSGRRSARTCEVMSEMGFTSLYNLSGGYQAWTNS